MKRPVTFGFLILVSAICFSSIGCKTSQPRAVANARPTGPAGSNFVCHLDCSGKEGKAYGVTREEAQQKIRNMVSEICNPDDGQYFSWCEEVN